MYLLYSLALSLLFIALLPYFIYQAIRHGKYANSFKERMGWLPHSIRAEGRPAVWVHTVSVGEFLAARPLIDRIRSAFPDKRVLVSTTTLTGQRLARAEVPERFDGAFYFPFDWRFSVRRAMDQVRPSLVVILETELWPNFLRECNRRGVRTVIANGRISPRSFGRYLKARRFIGRVLRDVSLLVMQSEADADRARRLGAVGERVRVCGNLKYDIELSAAGGADLDRQFALSSSPHLIVAGSTAPGEEEMLLSAFQAARTRQGLERARLLVAPRHPERFDEVAKLVAGSGLKWARRSEPGDLEGSRAAEVILLDTIGELSAVYAFAAVVFVGGSLVARGGHNIIEPAVYAKPIIVGPHTENFRQVVSDFVRAGAAVQVSDAAAFTRELTALLSDAERARAMGEHAREILLRNRGATDCTVAAIKEVTGEQWQVTTSARD